MHRSWVYVLGGAQHIYTSALFKLGVRELSTVHPRAKKSPPKRIPTKRLDAPRCSANLVLTIIAKGGPLVATTNPPYLSGYGAIAKTLERLKLASTPEKFSQDFLATKLDLKGGSPKQVIPYLKRIGFLSSDGTPTELYERFRNDAQTGAAAAEAVHNGYQSLYDINEYIHDATDDDILGVIIQVTGAERNSKTAKAILGSFKVLRDFADFEASAAPITPEDHPSNTPALSASIRPLGELGIGYTINLNLPATSDIAVFDAIFKSLSQHLLR